MNNLCRKYTDLGKCLHSTTLEFNRKANEEEKKKAMVSKHLKTNDAPGNSHTGEDMN